MKKKTLYRLRIYFIPASFFMLLLVLSLSAQPDKRSGNVEKIIGEDILVRYQNINRPFSMGDVFFVKIDSQYIKIRAVYPMLSMAKCRIDSSALKYLKQFTKGLPVYYEKSPERETVVIPELVPENKSRFKKADGIITDTESGLQWVQNAGIYKGKFDAAGIFCTELDLGKHKDWRLPTKREFESLIESMPDGESFDYFLEGSGFVNLKRWKYSNSSYWTTDRKDKSGIWIADMSESRFDGRNSELDGWIIPVRGSFTPRTDFREFFHDNGNGTIIDSRTGLIWMKNADPAGSSINWESANGYIQKIAGYAGKSDWRIPTKSEMESLVSGFPRSEKIWKKMLSGIGFNIAGDSYWTSTDTSTDRELKYYLNFYTDFFDPWGDVRSQFSHRLWPVSGKRFNNANKEKYFVENSINTITDTRSGLMWAKRAFSKGGSWSDAVDEADNLKIDGYTGWRLANYSDIKSLISALPENSDPRYYLSRQGFFGFKDEYWLSSEYLSNDDSAWCFTLSEGRFGCELQSGKKNGWLVRGGTAKSKEIVSPFVKQGDDILTDIRSGLMWLKNGNAPGKQLTLREAVEYCARLSGGGYTDWRLPTVKELEGLIQGQKSQKDCRKSFEKNGFTDVQPAYWSSTKSDWLKADNYYSVISISDSASGRAASDDGKSLNGVWPVRSAK